MRAARAAGMPAAMGMKALRFGLLVTLLLHPEPTSGDSWTFVSPLGQEVDLPHPLGHSGVCTPGQVSQSQPCVLPVNTNVSFEILGAGMHSKLTLSLDVYPGPSCVATTSGTTSYDNFICGMTTIDGADFHITEPALFHSDPAAAVRHRSVVRLILPKGFDASGATLEGNQLELHDSMSNTTGTTVLGARILTGDPVRMGYGLTEPSPELVTTEAEERQIDGTDGDTIITKFRTGTTWGLRDPVDWDPKRILDIVLESPGQSSWDIGVEGAGAGSQVVERVQRAKLVLDGVRLRREVGRIESAMILQDRVFGLQVYKWPEEELANPQPDPSKILLRYYNTRINDPCADFTTVGGAERPMGCPELPVNLHWFNGTNKTQAILLCPGGTFVINGTSDSELQCAPCDPGYSSQVMAPSCELCPSGTFADISNPAIPGAGAVACDLCGKGRAAIAGSTACLDCLPGSFSDSNKTEQCHPCAQGFYAPNFTSTQCEACPFGTSTPQPGADAVDSCANLCLPGQAGVGGVEPCEGCPPGSFVPETGASGCLLCSPGSTATGGATRCEFCESGFFASSNGSTVCQACAFFEYAPSLGSAACELCPEDEVSSAAGFNSSTQEYIGSAYLEAVDSMLQEVTFLVKRASQKGSNSVDGCRRNCLPGEFSPEGGIDLHESPCRLCPAGKFSNVVAASVCTDCSAGTFAGESGSSSCEVCPAGYFSPLPGTATCGMCPPGSTSVVGSTECFECPGGKFTPAPGSRTCLDCGVGTFSGGGGALCTNCPDTFTTVAPAASNLSDCVSYSSLGVIAHWELSEAHIIRDSSSHYTRMMRNDERCREQYPIDMSPTMIRDSAGGVGPARLQGPLCRQGTEWDTPGGNQMSVETFLATDAVESVMQFDTHINTGLVVGDVETLRVSTLPSNSIAVEAWFTVEEADSSYSGIAGAFQKRQGYGKGWALGHYMDANRDDSLFLSFQLAVQANEEAYNDFTLSPGLEATGRSRGGLFNLIGRKRPAPPLGSWIHVVAQYSSNGPAQIWVNGEQLVSERPCMNSVSCGPILYPELIDFWGSRDDTLFTIGGVHDIDAQRFIGHRGLLSMFRLYERTLLPQEIQQMYKVRASQYAATARLTRWYWSGSTELPLLSPSASRARVDVNALANFSDRFDVDSFEGVDLQGLENTVFQVLEFENITVWGRFAVGETYRCRWIFGSEGQDSATGELLDSGGSILMPGEETVTLANRLRCRLPDWSYGQTSNAILTVEQLGEGRVWQRVCVRESCGYVPPQRRSDNNGIWWIHHGMENLVGLKSFFEFIADSCSEGSFSPLGGVRPWCEPCPAGYFSDAQASVSCKACGIGEYSSQAGSTSCDQCPSGSATATNGSSSAGDCREQCPAGLFGGTGGIAPCFKCAKGTFSDQVGTTQCQQCEVGKSTLPPAGQGDGGVTLCAEECQAGREGPGGLAPCVDCRPGFFSETAGSRQCGRCEPGFYSIAGSTSCTGCPATCELAKLQGDNPVDAALRDQCCLGAWSLS